MQDVGPLSLDGVTGSEDSAWGVAGKPAQACRGLLSSGGLLPGVIAPGTTARGKDCP